MANLTAKLSTSATLEWQDERCRQHECEVEIDYTFDGEDVKITGLNWLGNSDSLDDYTADEMIHDAVMDVAPEAYAEWLAEYGEYLADLASDRGLAA